LVVERRIKDLLEKKNGERRPDVSLAAHPKAFLGCSISYSTAISIKSATQKQKVKDRNNKTMFSVNNGN